MKCLACGGPADIGDKFCGTCGSAVSADDAVVPYQQSLATTDSGGPALGNWSPPPWPEPARGPTGLASTADQGMPPYQLVRRLPDSPVRAGIDEVLWRRYHVLRMSGVAKGAGHLYVTDSRVVFFAYSNGFFLQKPSILVRETKIKEITGIHAYVTRRFSFALLWASIILGISGIAFALTFIGIPFALLLWLASAICFLAQLTGHGRVGTTVIRIHSKHGVSPVHLGGAVSAAASVRSVLGAIFPPWRLILGGTTAAYLTAFGLPGTDSDQVVAELGALIQDLQTRGDLAAPYWQVPLPERSAERGVVLQ
jgi:hypothetical protein